MAMHSGWKNQKLTEEEIFKISEVFKAPAAPDDIDVSDWSIGKLKAFCEQHHIRAGKMKRPELTRRVRGIIFRKQEAEALREQIANEESAEALQ